MSLKELNARAKAAIAELGLRYVKNINDAVANETANFYVRNGKIIIELHIKPADSDDLYYNACREVAAKELLDKRGDEFIHTDFYHTLTAEQKAAIEPKIFGYGYINL